MGLKVIECYNEYSLYGKLRVATCMYRVLLLIRVDILYLILYCSFVLYCKGMPITSSALGAMPPSSMQTFVNYSYCIDHLLKEINVTLNLNLNLRVSLPENKTFGGNSAYVGL